MLLPIIIMVKKIPAILPSQPVRPNTRNAPAINPTMLNPDTLPCARLLKKLPNIFPAFPLETPLKKLDAPSSVEESELDAWLTLSKVCSALPVSLFTVSVAAFAVPLMALVVSSPMTASLTMRTTLLSVVSFSQPTYPAAAPTVAVFNALPAPRKVCDGCNTAPPTALPVAPAALPPVFNNELQNPISFCFYILVMLKSAGLSASFPPFHGRPGYLCFVGFGLFSFRDFCPHVTHRGVFHRHGQPSQLFVHQLQLGTDSEHDFHPLFLRHLVV
ncbi:hypothetical protein EVA_00713 [gut metagenome]|uniref:Uncharacterized protein n=1 Tax=gut metagenome TaxID=749906 RepID=J9GQQ0_9ZZZZ